MDGGNQRAGRVSGIEAGVDGPRLERVLVLPRVRHERNGIVRGPGCADTSL